MDAQSFAPIGLHKTDAASDWLLIKHHYIGRNKERLAGSPDTKLIGLRKLLAGFSIYRKEDV
jgi:hypothetical protein